MSPIEVDLSSFRHLQFNEIYNDKLKDAISISLWKERMIPSKIVFYQRKMTQHYNSEVKKKSFQVNELMLQGVFLSSNDPGVGTFGPN